MAMVGVRQLGFRSLLSSAMRGFSPAAADSFAYLNPRSHGVFFFSNIPWGG
jgi:hypothetical protein